MTEKIKTLEQRLAEFRKSLYKQPPPSSSTSSNSPVSSIPDVPASSLSLLLDSDEYGEPELSSIAKKPLVDSSSLPLPVPSLYKSSTLNSASEPVSGDPSHYKRSKTLHIPNQGKKSNSNRSRSVGPAAQRPSYKSWRSRSVTSNHGDVEISQLAFPTSNEYFSRSSSSNSVHSRKYEGELARIEFMNSALKQVRIEENQRNIKEERRKWQQEKEEQAYKLRQAKAIHEREKQRFQEKVEAMTLQWNEQKKQLEKQKEKLKKQKDRLEKESKQLRMDRMKVRLMQQAEKETILGFDQLDADYGGSLKSEALDLWLKEPLEQLEIDRKEVRRREQEVNKAWDEIHEFKERLKRDSQKLKLDRAEYDQRCAHLDTLRSKFQNKEAELLKEKQANDAKQHQLSEVKKKLQNHMEKIKKETKQVAAQKQSIAEQKRMLEEKNKMVEDKMAKIEARRLEVDEMEKEFRSKMKAMESKSRTFNKDREDLNKSLESNESETQRLATLRENLTRREIRVREKEEAVAERLRVLRKYPSQFENDHAKRRKQKDDQNSPKRTDMDDLRTKEGTQVSSAMQADVEVFIRRDHTRKSDESSTASSSDFRENFTSTRV